MGKLLPLKPLSPENLLLLWKDTNLFAYVSGIVYSALSKVYDPGGLRPIKSEL